MSVTSDAPVHKLLSETTTVRLRPGYEGANIGTVIGFKHVYYLIEQAVIAHFQHSGLPVGELYERHALGFDVVDQAVRLRSALLVDDEAVVEVRPLPDLTDRLSFEVNVGIERDGKPVRAATATVSAVLRRDTDLVRIGLALPAPDGLEPFVVERIGAAEPGPAVTSTDADAVLKQLLAGRNGYGWAVRIPYTYVHFFERLQMSGYVRLMEEAKYRFVADRGISIGKLLAQQNWIPAVTQASVQLTGEALLEEDLYVTYVVENIFKNLLYTSRVEYHVVRDGRLVRVGTGEITHAYAIVRNNRSGGLVAWDERVAGALLGQSVVA